MSQFLDFASKEYYKGTPIITDEEFDALAQQVGYNSVGHTITNGTPHKLPMYSLQKYFNLDDAPSTKGYVSTPKLDGAAVSLLYVGGLLALGLTRGDGKLGRDITDKLAMLVPASLEGVGAGAVQITGEVVSPSSIENSRNYASGALNLKDLHEFAERDVTFVAYDIQGDVDFDLWTDAMSFLDSSGFDSVNSFDATNYPTDGIVFRVNSYPKFREMGYTQHHPRGAFALKEQKDGVVTKLLDVEWQVGKSGVVSPVAILEPVLIGDAMVSRATLHNIEYIQELNLELGCSVEVIRSGEIIPRIVRRV